jgi:hypothetical protein
MGGGGVVGGATIGDASTAGSKVVVVLWSVSFCMKAGLTLSVNTVMGLPCTRSCSVFSLHDRTWQGGSKAWGIVSWQRKMCMHFLRSLCTNVAREAWRAAGTGPRRVKCWWWGVLDSLVWLLEPVALQGFLGDLSVIHACHLPCYC